MTVGCVADRSATRPSGAEYLARMEIRSTTICAVRRDGKIAMAGDGQVTVDKTVMKHGARKVRRIANGKVLAGFAGERRRRHHPAREVRGQAERVQGQRHARRRRAGQGLAPRPCAAPARSAADRRDGRASVRAQRHRRRDRARRRRRGDRQRRSVRASGGDGAARPHRRSTPPRSRAKRCASPDVSTSTPTTTFRC